MSRYLAVLPLSLFLTLTLHAQQGPAAPPPIPTIPAEAARQPNPVKSTPESLARAKKWWGLDCAMCHSKNGEGKGDTARDMKLQMSDFTDPATLKSRTDGELFYIIKNGYQDMPGEGERLKPDDTWDLVNYVRSLTKSRPGESKTETAQKPQ